MIYLSVVCCCSWGHSNLQVNKNPMTCLPSHTFIYSILMLCNKSKYICHIEYSFSNIIIPSQRLVTIPGSLCTQTVLRCLIIQVLNTRVWFLNDSLTSVCSNLEPGLAILTESFSPLRSVLHNLSCWSPNQKCMLSYAIPFYTMYT